LNVQIAGLNSQIAVDEPAARHGFTANRHPIEINGLCLACRAKAA
jgi:Fe2+ or Zn2+ uptake regulation protein